MHEVMQYVVAQLSNQNARIDGYFTCPYVDSAYVAKKKGKATVHPHYVKDGYPFLKPNPGMVEAAIVELHKKAGMDEPVECVYVIGDRYSDMELAMNVGNKGIPSKGILVPEHKTNELGDEEKVRALVAQDISRWHIAKNFRDAAHWIERDVQHLRSL